jgi:hypothetical protein
MNTPQPWVAQRADAQMLDMLTGVDASASMPAIQHTRRVVLQAANELREQRRRNRRNAAIVALTVTVLAMLLTPAIWSTVDDILGGEHFDELPGMVLVLILLLFSTVIGVLIMSFRNIDSIRHGRR